MFRAFRRALPLAIALALTGALSPAQAHAARAPALRPETVLLMGTDATGDGGRGGLRGNTDTMMLVTLVPEPLRPLTEGARITVLSIPRDTRVRIPGHGAFKINACNAWSGPQLAVRAVSAYLGVHVDHYLLVDLRAMSRAVDEVGGVDVTVPARMDYDDHAGHLHIHLRRGRHHLDGRHLEAYVRFRHDDRADIGRIARQQALLREVAGQVLAPQHLLRFPALWRIVRHDTETDLTPAQLIGLAWHLHGLDARRDVRMAMLPGTARTVGGVSYWIGDREAARPLVDRFVRLGG